MPYKIAEGDTLGAIATANKTDVNSLLKLNPNITDPNKIYAGQDLNLPDSNVIQTPQVIPQTPVVIPPVPQDTNNYMGTIDASANDLKMANDAQMKEEEERKKMKTEYTDLMNSLIGKEADTQVAQQSTGQISAGEQISRLNAEAQSLFRESQGIPLRVQEANRNTGATEAGIAPQIAGALRINAIKALSLGQQYDIAKGNYDVAKDKADKIIDLKYKPLEQRLEILKQQYLFNKDTLERVDKKQADARAAYIKKQDADLADKKADELALQNLAINVSKNKAPLSVVNALTKLDTNKADYFNEAIRIASPYLVAPEDKLDVAYKTAQIAKIYNDMKNDNVASNIDPMNSLAYAQEYAATGKIPTGLPKGSFGQVAQWAKELPKQKGEIVSTATGVKPSTDNVYQDALASLNSAIELAGQLKDLDKGRIGGIVGGTLGKVFGDESQQAYADLRSQIIDLLSRARSGAALTVPEEKRYSDMLPTRFSEKFFLGADSKDRIDNFTSALSSDAKNKAAAKGWSIYGLSNVKVGDTEYRVGDIIKNEAGQIGRVNPDGSITLIQ